MSNVVELRPLKGLDEHEIKVRLMEHRMADECQTDTYAQLEEEARRRGILPREVTTRESVG